MQYRTRSPGSDGIYGNRGHLESITYALSTLLAAPNQIAGCNRLHEAEERLARWLLMAQDRTQSDVLNFTQEFLAMMLGARRTTVTLIAGALQKAGLIEYQRGHVKILDRVNLEAAACDCYRIIRDLHTNLYGQTSSELNELSSSNPAAPSKASGLVPN